MLSIKRPFSLLEVCIALALTTILLTALFSGFRHLMATGAKIGQVRQALHPSFVFQMRLEQILENIPSKALFYTEPHEEGQGTALCFTFQNGVDPDPHFCGEIEGTLLHNKNNELILKLKEERVETFFTQVDSFQMRFFHPKEKKWVSEWKEDFLPPLAQFEIEKKTYSFLLPKANQEVIY